MVKLIDKNAIIKLYQRGESYRKISKLLGINRRTVTKYCIKYQKEVDNLKTASDTKNIQEEILSKPRYKSVLRNNRKYNKDIDSLLNRILEDEKEKDAILGKSHKQSLTNKQIHKIIADAGHDISNSTIYNKLRKKRDKAKECFIRQEYDYGDRMEFDFGEVLLVIQGKKIKYHIAVISSPGGKFRWAYLYKNQKKEVFLDAHVEFFEMVGGVYKEVVYDNMKNVVSKFLGKNEKRLNEDLINLSLYYGFDINVTNAFSGNEKGHVESSVKILRNEVFAIKYRFNSFEEAREHLLKKLLELSEDSNIEFEKKNLLPYKPKLDIGKIRVVKINKYGFARINKNIYSVPDHLTSRKIIAKIYHENIKFYRNNKFICEHKKIDGENESSVDIRHYLKTFKKKPGAIRNSLVLKSIPKLKSIYDIYYNTNSKKFIELLNKYQDLELSEIIYKLKFNAINDNEIKDENITLITENQLYMYNQLSVKEMH